MFSSVDSSKGKVAGPSERAPTFYLYKERKDNNKHISFFFHVPRL